MDSNAGTTTRLINRWGDRAQLAGTPVAFCQGTYRWTSVSNSEGSV